MRPLPVLALVLAAACGGSPAVDDAALGSDAAIFDAPPPPPADALDTDAPHIAGTPAELRFDLQPMPSLAGQPLDVRVAIVDADGFPVASAAGPVELTLDATSVPLGGDAIRNTSLGVAAFDDLHIDTPGVYTLTANGDGLPALTSEPFPISLGPPSSVGSTVVASPKNLDADGVLATTITVRAANAFGIPIPGAPIAIDVDGSGNLLGPSSGTADGSGELTTTLASTVAEKKTITATIDAATVTATMTFVDLCRLAFEAPPLFPLSGSSSSSVAGDFDGDGTLDVATVDNHGAIHVVLAVGVTPREVVSPFLTSFGVEQLLAADLDHDGKLDLVARVGDTSIAAALGHGDGSFGAAGTTLLPSVPFDLAVGDFDHDNLPDLAAPLSSAKQVAILRGTGAGAFTTTLLAAGGEPAYVAIADVNADGKPDVIVGDGVDFNVRAYLGNGAGGFAAPLLSTADIAGPIFVGDLDGNGALDFVMLEQSGIVPYLGNKAGKFTRGTAIAGLAGPAQCLQLGDVTGDGVLDVVTCAGLQVAKGKGDGSFTAGTPVNVFARVIALADVDGDAVPDAVIDAGGFIGAARNLGGAFEGPVPIATTATPIFSVTADFDGDTFTDVGWEGGALLSRPGGALVTGPNAPNDDPLAGLAAVADYDGNGAPDLVIASTSSAKVLEVLLNDGTGTFHRGAEPSLPISFDAIGAGDFDQDGHPDLAVAGPFGDVFVLFGDGTGTSFTTVRVAFTNGTSSHGQILAADFDGDGFADLVTANQSGVNVFRSIGNRSFENPVTLRAGGARVAVADFDGDGHPDVLVVGSSPAEMFRGVGDGTFEAPRSIGSDYVGDGPEVVDIDGDGTLDLVEIGGGAFVVAQGYGDGTFHDMRVFGFATGNINGREGHVVMDLDRDGRLDVVGMAGVVGSETVAHQRACLAR